MAIQGSPRRLQGWKEIADYLKATPRSAQRWEACLGLPIRRQTRIRGATVYATSDELDEWQRVHGEELAQEAKLAKAVPVPAAPIVAEVVVTEQVAEPATVWASPRARHWSRHWLILTAVGLSAVVGCVLLLLPRFRPPAEPQSGPVDSAAASAYAVPAPGAPISLAVRVGNEAATAEIANGAMTTVALASGRKMGFVCVRRGASIEVSVCELRTRPGGAEALHYVSRNVVSPDQFVLVDAEGQISLQLNQTVPRAAMGSASQVPPKTCCVTCGATTICAGSVRTSCGKCEIPQ